MSDENPYAAELFWLECFKVALTQNANVTQSAKIADEIYRAAINAVVHGGKT